VQKETVENAAAVTGGVVGFALAGPLGALVFAAISNYVSKKDNDAGVALRGFGKTVIESYNFLTTLNSKYDLTGKASATVKDTVTKVVAENESLDQVTKTLDTTVSKVAEINKEFGLVTKASQALVAAGTLTDAAFEKVCGSTAAEKKGLGHHPMDITSHHPPWRLLPVASPRPSFHHSKRLHDNHHPPPGGGAQRQVRPRRAGQEACKYVPRPTSGGGGWNTGWYDDNNAHPLSLCLLSPTCAAEAVDKVREAAKN